MNNRHILVIVLTVIVVIAAVLVSQHRAPRTSTEKIALFPALAERINEVSELRVRDGQTTLTVRRVSGNWRVAEADNYPALLGKVKQTVLAVSGLRVIAEKTDNPDLYERLGVEDPDSKGATSRLLTLSDAGGQLAELVVGSTRHSKSALGAPGLYVRIPAQRQALLVEGRLAVSAEPSDWIKRDIINIEADRVNSVRLRPAAGTEVLLNREKPADGLVLQNLPEGREQASEYLVGRMATMLENIFVEGVKKAGNIDFSSPGAVIEVTTFDGLAARVEVAKSAQHSYATFSFAVQEAGTDRGSTEANQDETATEAETATGEETSLTPGQEAESLNSLVQGWAYRLSSSKAELYNQTLSDLVRDPASEDAE